MQNDLSEEELVQEYRILWQQVQVPAHPAPRPCHHPRIVLRRRTTTVGRTELHLRHPPGTKRPLVIHALPDVQIFVQAKEVISEKKMYFCIALSSTYYERTT